jgi:hypothetical protein
VSPQRKRGRSALLPPALLETLRQADPQLRTQRSLLNRFYCAQAFRIPEEADPEHERYGWLLGWTDMASASQLCARA